jgi:hypothetical protein
MLQAEWNLLNRWGFCFRTDVLPKDVCQLLDDVPQFRLDGNQEIVVVFRSGLPFAEAGVNGILVHKLAVAVRVGHAEKGQVLDGHGVSLEQVFVFSDFVNGVQEHADRLRHFRISSGLGVDVLDV